MLAPSVMMAVSVPGQSINLGWEESHTAETNLKETMVLFLESSTVTNLKEISGMKRWKAPQARNLNFGKGSLNRETNRNGQGQT